MNVSWHCHCLTLAYLEKQAHQKTNNIMQQNKKKYDPAMMPRLLHYSDFLNGSLILGLDLSFYKCAILTCRRSVKRISWNKVLQRWHFCDKTLPFSKTILSFLSLVWWESQFTVESRSHVFFRSLDRILIASFQMYVVMKNRLDIQRSRKQICRA